MYLNIQTVAYKIATLMKSRILNNDAKITTLQFALSFRDDVLASCALDSWRV